MLFFTGENGNAEWPNKYAGPNNKLFTLHQHIRRKRERKTFCVIERLRRRGEKDKLDEMHKLERKFVIE